MFTTFILIILRLACYIILLLLLYSLFKPEKLNIRTNRNINGKFTKKKFYLTLGIIWVILVAIGISISESNDEYEDSYYSKDEVSQSSFDIENNDNKQDVEATIPIVSDNQIGEDLNTYEEIEEGTFGITLDDFDENIENLSKKLGLYDESEGKTTPYTVNKGSSYDTFSDIYTENESMIGILSKQGNIKEIKFIRDKTLQKGDDLTVLLNLTGSTVSGLDPQTDLYNNQQIIMSELQNTKDQFEAEGLGYQSGSIGNVTYIIEINEEKGTQVTLVPYI